MPATIRSSTCNSGATGPAVLPWPCGKGGANRLLLPTTPNGSQTASPAAFSVRFVPPLIALQFLSLRISAPFYFSYFASTAAGCLPSRGHWNNFTTLRLSHPHDPVRIV